MPSWLSQGDDAVTILVRVTPNGRRSEVIDTAGNRLRIRLAAPAVEGRANDELTRLLSALFGVRRSAVRIVAGARAREKTVVIRDVERLPEWGPFAL